MPTDDPAYAGRTAGLGKAATRTTNTRQATPHTQQPIHTLEFLLSFCDPRGKPLNGSRFVSHTDLGVSFGSVIQTPQGNFPFRRKQHNKAGLMHGSFLIAHHQSVGSPEVAIEGV
jgi:hypothetical protein